MMFVPFQQPHMAAVKQVAKRTKSACINCKAAKVGCSSERPCLWCLRHDLQDTCVDAPKKARNTKRRRSASDGASTYETTEDVSTPSPPPISHTDPSSPHSHVTRPSPPVKRRAARGKRPPPTDAYDSPDSGSSDVADVSASSPPPSPFNIPPGSSNLPYNQTGNFPYAHRSSYGTNQMMIVLPSSTSTPTPTASPSLSLPAPSASPSPNMPLSAFPPFISAHPPNASPNQRYAQNIMQHYQYQLYQNQLTHQHHQLQPQHILSYQQLSQQPYFQPSSNTLALRSTPGGHLNNTDFLSTSLKHPPSLLPPASNSIVGVHTSFAPSATTTTTALGSSVDTDEDITRSISESIDNNTVLIQSLLTSQRTLAQLTQQVNLPSNTTNTNSNGNTKTTEINNSTQPRSATGSRKSTVLNSLLLDELASLQQCLETISALSQIQTGTTSTVYPSATLKIGTPITISNCNEPFSKLIGYDSCYEYFCNGDTSLESIILPQFISYVNRKLAKMMNYAAPKLLRPTMIVTKQGGIHFAYFVHLYSLSTVELKCCYAMLRTDIYGEGLCNITIIKQGAAVTNRFRHMMSESPLAAAHLHQTQQHLQPQQPPQQQPQQPTPQQTLQPQVHSQGQPQLHQMSWEKKT